MKKIFLSVVLTCVFMVFLGSYAMAENVLNLSYDFGGTIREDNGLFLLGQTNIDPGITVGYEYLVPQDNYSFGFGFEYPFERSMTNYQNAKFNFVPVYFVINGNSPQGNITPFFTLRLGYNFQSGNSTYQNGWTLNGGLYGALGGGVSFNNQFRCMIIYTVNGGTVSNSWITNNVVYSRFGVMFGYTF